MITDNGHRRMRISVSGAVQGVGFRPFVYRLANSLGLFGWVANDERGVIIEIEGNCAALDSFLERLVKEKPTRSIINKIETEYIKPLGVRGFTIRSSFSNGEKTLSVQPDIAVCEDCLKEIYDPKNRRYLYPFTNCTKCGPRFSIIESVPYDRKNTSMKDFKMCAECAEEYNNPNDRRYHAQPIACPVCGPHIELWDKGGNTIEMFYNAIVESVRQILDGKIVAVKGLGGFHLIVDAQNEDAVLRLRKLKHREEKPLAVMFPSIEYVKDICLINKIEEELLLSPEAPIVLVHKNRNKIDGKIAPSVAPNNPYIGAILPYTPLHHILLREIGKAVVATSGNISDEPICIDEREALERLKNIADLFLVHNRRIVRHIDDSVVAVVRDKPMVIRRARGYAPLPIEIPVNTRPTIAVGGQLKNTVGFAFGTRVFLSQHIGDLETLQAYIAFKKTVNDLPCLYEKQPQAIVSDLHPDYASTQFAESSGVPLVKVQHHYAHIMSCVAENRVNLPVLGVSWDGTGYGGDGTIWGGEFLYVDENGFRRVAHFKLFPLLGGDTAIKEPRKAALGMLYEAFGDVLNKQIPTIHSFSNEELAINLARLKSGKSIPLTSSAGRIFDAVASIIGLRQICKYEGQAAMELEFATDGINTEETYPISLLENKDKANENNKVAKFLNLILDWKPLLESIINDYCGGESIRKISARFHNSMVKFIVEVVKRIREKQIVLSGGCFQNRYLTEKVERDLLKLGINVYRHQNVPPNDGGLALGQIMAGAAQSAYLTELKER
ncbi:MAG: carbamoyltransferase HypF [Verrucomicrobiia bacterium]